MQTNNQDLVGSAQAALILDVDRATFNRWAKRGLVPTALIAPGLTGMRLYRRTDIEDYAKNRLAA